MKAPKLSPISLKYLMRMSSLILHPVFIFVLLQIVSISLTVIWVVWYVKQSSVRFVNTYDVAFLVTGCILTSIILLGTVVLFVFAIKQSLLNKQQRSFVSSVTHELRSPIASMQLSLETMQSKELDAKTTKTLFNMINSDLERLVRLVDQILVSSRLDRGINLFQRIETFDLKELIGQAVSAATHLQPSLQDRIIIQCPSELVIRSSKPALELIFNNLLENAVKYSPPTSPIKIALNRSGNFAQFVITDKGMGLDKREARRVFKIFIRGDQALKEAIPGTGLGLYIVKAIVKVLGGKVWAESEGHGHGSTFFVKLPLEIDLGR